MSGRLTIVGLGPGAPELTTPAVLQALREATDLVGYDTYLARVPELAPGQRRHASDNRVELDRARHALRLAADGRRVAVVSSGDPGVFAMAAAVFEAVDGGRAGVACAGHSRRARRDGHAGRGSARRRAARRRLLRHFAFPTI